MVLPHWALFKAACKSSPAFTLMTAPGAGVCAIELSTVATGSCAGPSVDCPKRLTERAEAKTKINTMRCDITHLLMRHVEERITIWL
jgi:hypothetical protein